MKLILDLHLHSKASFDGRMGIEEIAALASASETISGIDGIYMAIFIGVPLCKWLYKKLEPTLGRVTRAGRRAAEAAAREQ